MRAPFNRSVAIRGAFLLIFAISLMSCTTSASSPKTTLDLAEPTSDVLDAISDLEEELTSIAPSRDLSMAWTDLRNDIRSVVPELTRDPGRVDIEGFRNRMAGFPNQYATINDPSIRPRWIDLVSAFDSLVVSVTEPGQKTSNASGPVH